MATLLLEPPRTTQAPEPSHGTATLGLLMSPLRGPDGHLRVLRQPIAAGRTIAEVLPARQVWYRVIWNGRALTADEQATYLLADGDEVLAIPQWGTGLEPFLITFAIGLAISLAVTGLQYLLFPPQKPHIAGPLEDPTFSFEGIRTTVGPGGVVPVIYGRYRVGGQLLSASVDQVFTILDDGVSSRRVTALAQPPTLSLLLALGEGPIGGVLTDTIELNGQPIGNFPTVSVYVRTGTPDQTPMPEFGETANTFTDAREITVGAGVTYTTTAPVQAFVLNIVFNEGLYVLTSKGDKEDNVAVVSYQWRDHATGVWSGFSTFEIAAARTSVVRLGIRREGLALSVYDINVVFSHAFTMDEKFAKWTPTLESVTEIQHNTNAYPNTVLLGFRATPTESMQGALPNVTVEVVGRTVRLNTFQQVETYTDNPAWCVLDFLTNTRYGLGIPDADIDLTAFAVYATYCDEIVDGDVRHRLNYVLDREQRAQPALLEMMGGSRAMLFKSEGLWTPRPTRDEAPVQLLTWANVTNLKLTYTRDADQINVMEARYANASDQYQQDVLTWPTIEHWPVTVRKASLDIRGVTSPARIMRALQFELNRRRFETLTVEMDCALDACVLQLHDVFRFSHPLPGWGVSGRIQAGSDARVIVLDETVTFEPGNSYHLYVRHEDGTVEAKPVAYPADGPATTLFLTIPLSQGPAPRTSRYAFGKDGPETAVKLFRVTKIQRKTDTTVHLEGVIHNPSIYDEPFATELPITTSLFNPLGPPPPLTSLILTEVTRVQANGASLRVVNLSWDVAALTSGYGPYGGVTIFRRTVLSSALAGSAEAGVVDLGAIQDPSDSNVNFVVIAHVRGHVLDFDDYTVLTGTTYLYRVVPVSQRGVPNTQGMREGLIHVSGPTTPDFFPGTVQNLRLSGQPVGAVIFEGRDVHLTWDPVADSPLFTETFFVQDYLIEVWAPGQVYRLRQNAIPIGPHGVSVNWAYTFEMNAEDQIQAGQPGARRDLSFYVWARTNTGRISLDPAHITVVNPPPDMSNMIPDVTGLINAGIIKWGQFVEPRDFASYQLYLDTVNPPIALYQSTGLSLQRVAALELTAGVTYYTYILPFDTFGPGLPSQIASFMPAETLDLLDTTPPALPTGLTLSTGSAVGQDGTIVPWVEAAWVHGLEPDLAGYEVHMRVAPSLVPTVFSVGGSQSSVRLLSVPGNVTVFAKIAAFDKVHNISPFTDEVSITTARDTVPPFAPTNLTAIGSIKSVALLWTPPPDPDYAYAQVWSAAVNNRASAVFVGTGVFNFIHEGLGPNDTRYYWIRSVDTSGNVSVNFTPSAAAAGIAGTAGQLDTTFISSLAATKIISGTIQALVNIGVANIALDGVNSLVTIHDSQATPVTRVLLGKLGFLSDSYGMRIFNPAGQMMWNLTDGVQTEGISDRSITAPKIEVGAISAEHLTTSIAVITTAAQIAFAIIEDAHINALSADKIVSGTIDALIKIGIGSHVNIDGVNTNMSFYDNQGTPALRVLLGKVGSATTDYGLQVWSASGQLMWNFTDGAQTAGLAPASVITEKIITNAVTDSVQYASGSTLTTTTLVTQIASVTIPELLAGDEVWIHGCCECSVVGGGSSLALDLLENGIGGTNWQRATLNTNATLLTTMLNVPTIYPVSGTLINKVFVLVSTAVVGTVLENIRLIARRVKR